MRSKLYIDLLLLAAYFHMYLLFFLEEFKNYAKSYLNNMVAQMSKRTKAPKQEESSRKKLNFKSSKDLISTTATLSDV